MIDVFMVSILTALVRMGRLAAVYPNAGVLAEEEGVTEPLFDSLTELAALTFDTPVALISLVDQDRQWFKACVGVDFVQTTRDISFCQHAIRSDAVCVVPSA